MYDLSLIKNRISCVTYAQRVGLPITKSGDRCVSPLRDGAKNPTAFVVYDDYFYDFGDGTGGDVIELCAAFAHGGNRGAAIRELATLAGVVPTGTDNTAEWLDYTNRMNAMTAYYHENLTDDDRDYLHSRGLTDDDISRLKIGRVTDGPLRGRLFLPYFNNGYVCYYATRALPGGTFPDSKYMKQKRDDHCQHLPWGLQTLNRDSDTLVIAEGYFDAVAFETRGYPVLSAITGIFSKSQINTVLSVARNFKRVFIVYDDDSKTSNAGEKFTNRMSDILTRNRIPFVVGTVPPPYHDISEYYAAGGDLSKIIDGAEAGISYIASKITDFSELETFIYTVARHTRRSEIEAVISHLKLLDRFDPRRLENLFKSATKAPPETIIADEILRDHQLVYIDHVGFYEYQSGVWKKISDNHVRAYADRSYGEFSTAQRVTAIANLLKTRALRSVEFDKQPVWNFINGTLELDTGVFRDHNPNDFCSVQASYPYNPDATYDAWSKFIDDITAGDPKASEILQFIPGYTLMQDCRYEKIFALTGAGGNGKSKYLAMLQQLFGDDSHVTYLKPKDLLADFKRIQLKDSIINIAGEIRSDLREVEEVMKSIASGEPQTACFKGKDYVNFTPRTKLVYACNGQLSSEDTSDALTRRLVIMDFKVSFVDNPDPSDPYQRQKDVHILDALTDELRSGGIFNWCYEGYKLLKTVGYFTETNDQVELIQNFKRASNPVLLFWEDDATIKPHETPYQQMYSDYVGWCDDNGYRPRSSLKFHLEFKKVAAKYYDTVEKSVRIDGKPRKQRCYVRRDDYTTT